MTALSAFLVVFVLARYGVLATIATFFFYHLWVFFPLTAELTAWYATSFLLDLTVVLGLAVYGFVTSLGGQPLFGKLLLDN